jgi:hypothetical protein
MAVLALPLRKTVHKADAGGSRAALSSLQRREV